MQKIIIQYNTTGNLDPVYSSADASGADIKADISNPVIIDPGKRALIPTGLKIEIPEGYEGQIRPRSGLAIKNGITVLNSPGTIDADYRGEIKIILINHSDKPFQINKGDRIAQIVFSQIIKAKFSRCSDLSVSARSGNGFGSTGTK